MSATPTLKLKTAKHIAPEIFTNQTPKLHIGLLNFLASPDKYKVAAIFRGAGKTTVVTKVDTFSSIWHEHEPYHQIFSVNEKKAKKFLKDVKTMIRNAIRKGYDIQIKKFRGKTRADDKDLVWNDTEIEVVVDGKFFCYVEALGAGQDPRGGSFNFMRPTLQTFDDIESKRGQYAITSKSNREKLLEWFEGDCLPALDPIFGRVRFIGTILHEDSLLSNILKDDEWVQFIQPIIKDDGTSAWKDRFPLTDEDAIKKKEEIFKATGKVAKIRSIQAIKRGLYKKGLHNLFYQEYLCLPQAEEKKLFKKEMFKYYSHIEYDDKVSYFKLTNALEHQEVPIRKPKNIVLNDGKKIAIDNTIVYSTMDLATKDGKDKTVIITCGYDSNNNMYVLDISYGDWTPFDKSVNAIKVYKEFKPLKFGIEKAGMQNDYFYTIDEAQKASGVKIPVKELSHGGIAKNIRIKNIHPLFMVGKVFFNESDPATSILEAQFNAFDPEVEGSNDDLIDTLAYQHQFIKGRTFENEEYEEEEESSW
ncbi:MAG: hypothetical protein KAQ94_05945 [Arcobacteraceae bacterium]|nr:hypothetical protein [Arcobacteraceae bacterium]